ncbi:MAG: YicC family protein [Clostridia bacterium]|nr:YicC family protein [Clostridia bacterium]
MLLYSMTGFGKGTAECEGGTVTVEIKTVNSKSLDLSIKLPRELFAFEADVKKAVQSGVTRGKTDVFVQFARSENAATAVKVDWALAEAYIKAGKEASERLNIDWKTDVDRLFKIPDVITVERPEPDAEALGACVRRAAAEAVENLKAMRLTEGASLEKELKGILSDIKGSFTNIRARAPFVAAEYRDKLNARIAELLGKPELVDGQRLAQEVAYFADKADITEEIARIDSHLAQLDRLLEGGAPVGRELDFIVQEFKREINTLGSKSNDSVLFKEVLNVKGKLESFREQIQNIE